jgi:hypothetical protein
MRNLEPYVVDSVEEIEPRLPWLNQPDCLNCHVDYELAGVDAFNRWTPGAEALYRNRTAGLGVMCTACHNSPHAIYPAANRYGEDRDNVQPLQYQGIAGTIATEGNCFVCHGQAMAVEGHHRRMLHR